MPIVRGTPWKVFKRSRLDILATTPSAPPGAFDTELVFVSSVEDTGGGIYGKISAVDADVKFKFNEIIPRVGMPRDLEITDGGSLLVITFTSDYDGEDYVYVDTDGVSHAGIFPSGNGTVSF